MKSLLCLFFSISIVFFASLPTWPREITEVEAAHLTEQILPNLETVHVERVDQRGAVVYEITGKRQQDGYLAKVHASAGRVLSIEKNGEIFYQWEGVKAVGHRGNVLYAPENTIPAFQKAIELGVDLIEIDIRETKDGHMVIMHDPSVDRTTNGTGNVCDLTLEEIKKFDAGSWFSPEFTGVQVPTYEEALEAMKGKAFPDNDFKAGTPEKIIEVINEFGLQGKTTVCCEIDEMKTLRQKNGEFLWRPSVPVGFIGLPILIQKFDSPLVNVDWPEFSERLIQDIHLSGKKSFVNTMQQDTEWAIQKVIETLPDYIQSDRMDILLPLLRAKGLHK